MVVKRYIRRGECNRCGWCCLQEDPPCSYLERNNDGTYTCTVYDDEEKRYKRCGIYPSSPPINYIGCGYYFIDIWDDNKKVTTVV
jgi:hypothetical protein